MKKTESKKEREFRRLLEAVKRAADGRFKLAEFSGGDLEATRDQLKREVDEAYAGLEAKTQNNTN